ncbi:MAG: FtsW/RodA/SpoVE family cell cycle protein [Bacteroidales bacterium]|nr:FtsW/RodA/SpoVE family cell cycle protein [Bacteroidales bacterium]
MIKNNINKVIKGDKTIIIIVAVLMLISALLMGSSLTKMALDNTSFDFGYLIRQLFFSAIAFTMMIILSQTPYQIYSKLANSVIITAGILTVLTMIFGKEIGDAKRWFEIPIIGIKFQTSDFVKLAIVIYISKLISEFDFINGKVNEILKKILIPTLFLTLLTAMNDLSTAILMYITIFGILFITPINLKYLGKIFGVISLAAILFVIFSMATGFARGNTWKNRLFGKEDGYSQKLEAKIAISNGGLIIKPGKSLQKHRIENSYSDYIFAVLAEEYGIWGVVLVIGLYIIFMYRIAEIIKRQRRSFPMFLTLGISINILFQAFLHILVNVGIVPVTGQPLPLISHGGTSMILTAAQIGIILNISQLGKNTETSTKPTYVDEINATEEEIKEIQPEQEKQPEIEINDYPFLIG